MSRKNSANKEKDYLELRQVFLDFGEYKESVKLADECLDMAEKAKERAEEDDKNKTYESAVEHSNSSKIIDLEYAIDEFDKISGWKDADQRRIETQNKVSLIKKKEKSQKSLKLAIFFGGIAIAIIIIGCIAKNLFSNINATYNEAVELFENGDYDAAYDLFQEINYKDSDEYIKSIDVIRELNALNDGSVHDLGDLYEIVDELTVGKDVLSDIEIWNDIDFLNGTWACKNGVFNGQNDDGYKQEFYGFLFNKGDVEYLDRGKTRYMDRSLCYYEGGYYIDNTTSGSLYFTIEDYDGAGDTSMVYVEHKEPEGVDNDYFLTLVKE